MKGQGMLISAFVFALVIAIFAVINVDSVQVNFLFAKTTTPLILVILVSTLLGGLTVGLFGLLRQYRLQRTIRSLEKELHELMGGHEQSGGGYRKAKSVEAAAAAKGELSSDAAGAEPEREPMND
ncbi:LapA family protein [Paenibacillus harenae]|uniref:LapA family protein n=1 Tax=Paenibacillus harenae TaxID=306543 RepID=UPI002794905A|nr:lipopolysaccharide assembly protein LapA domain-containing protein [Paenibacillus harenae]MDQ0063491.1 putative integral membrane protein [Paenibacillus harenae]